MATTTVRFNEAGGHVTIGFATGPIVSHWMARLTTNKIQKQDFEGTNDDHIPDRISLPAPLLAEDGLLSWWVVVFGPAKAIDYTVTVTVSQDGEQLCPPLRTADQVKAKQAESVSGVLSFVPAARQ